MANQYDDEIKKQQRESELLMILEMAGLYSVIRSDSRKVASRWANIAPEGNILQWLGSNNRDAKLQAEIRAIKPEYIKVDNFIKRRMQQDYNTEYYRKAYTTVQQFRDQGYSVRINKYLDKQLEKAITSPLSKYMNPQQMASDRNRSLTRIYQVIRQGLLEGDSLQKINKNIDIELGYRDRDTGKLYRKPVNYKGDFYNRMRVLRTEINRVRGSAETDEYRQEQKQGIESELVLVEVLDNRTRAQSAQMDGQVADAEGLFTFPNGVKAPRGQSGVARWDINDRSTTITVLPHDSIEDYARSRRVGKSVETVPYQDFSAYAKDIGMTKNKYGQYLWGEA